MHLYRININTNMKYLSIIHWKYRKPRNVRPYDHINSNRGFIYHQFDTNEISWIYDAIIAGLIAR